MLGEKHRTQKCKHAVVTDMQKQADRDQEGTQGDEKSYVSTVRLQALNIKVFFCNDHIQFSGIYFPLFFQLQLIQNHIS